MAAYSVASSSLLAVTLIVLSSVGLVGATDHIVGAHLGWNPGINYTSWINNQTFYVGDLISFRYQKYMYNVFEVNQTGYNSCSIEGALGNWTKGKDFIPLPEAKRYYFFCNGFCQQGMKISILVHPLPSPPPEPPHLSQHSAPNSTSAAGVYPKRLAVLPTSFLAAAVLMLASTLL